MTASARRESPAGGGPAPSAGAAALPWVARRTAERGLVAAAGVLGVLGLITVHAALYPAESWDPVVAGAVALAGFLVVHAALVVADSRGDEVLLPVAAALSAVGLVMIYRLRPDYAVRQAAWISLGLTSLLIALGTLADLRWVRRYAYLCALAGLVLLVLTVLIGVERNGARQWLVIGRFTLEPGEIVKLLLVAFFAGVLVEARPLLTLPGPRRWREDLGRLGPLLLVCVGALLLLVFQRDLGLAMLYYGVFLAMLYVAVGRLDYVLAGVVAFAGGAALCYHWFAHVRVRVDVWLNPWADAAGRGYQILQGLFALASGGLTGAGLGRGHPELMPASYTDMIFPAVGEDLGAVGTYMVVALYLLFLGRAFRAAIQADGSLDRLAGAGLAAAIGIQTFVILAGSTRLIPLTGIPAPFLTYGGSAAVSNFIVVAFLLAISDRGARAAADGRDGQAHP
ncbi:MAG TPA: FtsW/RodA/SpoVE family cell cycle protein [bacterium]|nr:FtsW/RodA/SpoVE family cell cycle protein [bacterium]